MAVTDSSEHQTPELDASSSSPDTVAGGMVADAMSTLKTTFKLQASGTRLDSTVPTDVGTSDELKWAILDNGPVCCTNYSCNGAQ